MNKDKDMRIRTILQASAYLIRFQLYIISLPFIGWWFYRRDNRINRMFCYNMCSHVIARTIYGLIFGTGTAAFCTCYVRLTHDITSTLMPMAVSTLFLFERVRHPLLTALRESGALLCGLMVVALASLFTPGMLPFAVSLYLLTVAAVFYPSRRAVGNFQSWWGIRHYRKRPDQLVDTYFS